MSFVFYIFLLLNYVSNSSNYVLKRASQDVGEDITSNDSHETLQENPKNTRNPKNLKVNLFDKRISDEILSIKQNIYGRDTSTKLKSTKINIHTPSSELKQKWPNEELVSKDDIIEENQRNVDDFDFRHLFPEEDDNTSPNTETPLRIVTYDHEELQHNQSKKNVIDLRSLSGQVPSSMIDQIHGRNVSHCACSRSLMHSNWAPEYIPFSIPVASPSPHKCTSCSKTTLSYSFMPIYIPYEPYVSYFPNIFKEDSMRPPLDDLYYYDDNDNEQDVDSDDEGYGGMHENTKSKKKKKNKSRAHEDSVIIDINYDVKPPETEVKWNTAFFEGRPNKLVKDLMDDLIMLYPDSVIRKCYCSSSYSSNYYSMTLFHSGFLLFILSDVVFRVILVE